MTWQRGPGKDPGNAPVQGFLCDEASCMLVRAGLQWVAPRPGEGGRDTCVEGCGVWGSGSPVLWCPLASGGRHGGMHPRGICSRFLVEWFTGGPP